MTDRAAARARHWPRGIARIGQGQGDLGQRMARALGRFLPAPVVLIGSDIPALGPAELRIALARLRERRFVFGPASDGGYWLVGLRGHYPVAQLFRGVRWSSEHALADTLANLGPRHKPALAPRLDDIDTGADYLSWRQSVAGASR